MMDAVTLSSLTILLVWKIHALSALAFGIGVVFLIAWALRTLKPAQLRLLGIWLVAIGAVVCLLISIVSAETGLWFKKADGMVLDHGDVMDHSMHEVDAMDHSMNDMMLLLEGKTGDDFDRSFIEMMVPHHLGAIEMAEAALEHASHAEIRALAEDIIEAQQAEIDQMHRWQMEWGYAG